MSSSSVWRNWTGDQVCTPTERRCPRNLEEVVEAVRVASDRDLTVRVAGAGHSFTDAVLTDGMLLSLEEMTGPARVDRATGLVRVGAGMSLKELNLVLDAHGLALENLGDIAEQSIAGATATGTHGTGARRQNLSASIRSIELVTADGSVREVDADTEPDLWRAARVGIGALGVVTAVTLRTVPAFTLHAIDEKRPLDEVMANLEHLADSNDHFEFYVFPYSKIALTRTNNITDDAPQPPSALGRWLRDELLVNHAYGLVTSTGRRVRTAIPRLNRFAAWASGKSVRTDKSFRIFATSRKVRFTEMEYALPRDSATEAITAVHDVASSGRFDVSFPIEVRFVAPDDAFLSPAAGRDTCYIAVHMFEGMEWEPYFRAIEEIADHHGGRPHWGKRHFQTAETLAPRYPQWDRFQAARHRADPQGLFVNDYVRRVLMDPEA